MNAPAKELQKVESKEVVIRFSSKKDWGKIVSAQHELNIELYNLKGLLDLTNLASKQKPRLEAEEFEPVIFYTLSTVKRAIQIVETSLEKVIGRAKE